MLVVNFFTTRVAASVLDFLFLEVIRVVVLDCQLAQLLKLVEVSLVTSAPQPLE